jgi:hypothetical protein
MLKDLFGRTAVPRLTARLEHAIELLLVAIVISDAELARSAFSPLRASELEANSPHAPGSTAVRGLQRDVHDHQQLGTAPARLDSSDSKSLGG